MKKHIEVILIVTLVCFLNKPNQAQSLLANNDSKRIYSLGELPSIQDNLLASSGIQKSSAEELTDSLPDNGVRHVKVFDKVGRFAGWPANHGMWSWDNEILVGFVEARYKEEAKGLHPYDQNTSRDRYARSLDGGFTWTIEDAFEQGQKSWRYNNQLGKEAEPPVKLSSAVDFTHPDFAITFLRATNHIGPSHFYYSYDRGKSWEGAYKLPDLGTSGIATRTDYIVDGPRDLLALVTVGKSNGREGRVACLRTTDGGKNWARVSWLGPEAEGFEIMPSSVRLSPLKIFTVVRKRSGSGQDLLASYLSEDNGASWQEAEEPVTNTGKGGSPPALVKLRDGRLALGYIFRSDEGSRVCAKFSSDEGQTWSDEVVLRGDDGANRDVGYPRMLQRPDGNLVIVYYWNNVLQEGSLPYRYIAATIFDPNKL